MHVTVLMAVYNAVDCLSTAVASIRGQSYTNWDLLIIDDGSTDGTSALLQAIAAEDPRITVVHSATNRGIAAALNLGWKQAGGELIARMDADDVSLPERLERQVLFLEAHPEVAVVGSGAELVNAEGEIIGAAVRPEQHEELVRRMYRETPFIHPSITARRVFYESMNGYDERWRRCEDTDLWLRSYRRFRFHNLQEPLIRYRVSNRQSLREIIERTRMLGNAARRDGRLLTHGWYAPRWLVGSLLTKVGLWDARLH
jgi:glycosyltransferase involved in cell wall biosynthesis